MKEAKKVEEEKIIDVEVEEVEEKEEGSDEEKDGGAEENEVKKSSLSVKTALIIVVLIILATLAFYFRGLLIAATVNGSPISRIDVIKEAEKQKGKEILDNLIVKQLLKEEAMKQKIRITKADVATEIAKLELQMKSQNTTLDQVLKEQGLTRQGIEEQITLQKQVEKMVSVASSTDEEVTTYITTNKITVPKGKEALYLAEIKAKITQDKFNQAAGAFVAKLKEKANIKYLVTY